MSIFCFKTLEKPTRLGEKLRLRREERGLSLTASAAQTRLPEKYLAALEAGDFSALPKARAFRVAYVREYADWLKLNSDECLKQLTNEEGLEDATQIHPRRGIKFSRFASWSMAIRYFLIFALVLCFAGYLAWQIHGVMQPPKLILFTPAEGAIISGPALILQGQTDPESSLTINGQTIMPNEQGQFESKIDLSAGVNTLTLTATKKHGKTTTIVRHIVVKTNPALIHNTP